MIEFVHPWLFLLLALPLFIIWLAPVYKERKNSIQVPYFTRLVDVTGETPQSGAVILSRNHIQRFLLLLAWLCLVTALAKPEMIGEPIIQEKSARDLMIAVDISGSMSVEDFTPLTIDDPTLNNTNTDTKTYINPDNTIINQVSRLTAVKEVLTHFAQQRKNDRLGLILFGDSPYLQAPFTNDISTWLSLLNESEVGMAGESTAFGDAIGLSISVFEQAKTLNRVLIVLTDGNDTASKVPPIDAAKVAAAYHIKIYTIAVGDPTAVGEDKVDLTILNQIAKITKGESFQALNREELQRVHKKINELEPQQFDSQSFRPRTSIHHYPMILFAVIYLSSLLIVSINFHFRKKRVSTIVFPDVMLNNREKKANND